MATFMDIDSSALMHSPYMIYAHGELQGSEFEIPANMTIVTIADSGLPSYHIYSEYLIQTVYNLYIKNQNILPSEFFKLLKGSAMGKMRNAEYLLKIYGTYGKDKRMKMHDNELNFYGITEPDPFGNSVLGIYGVFEIVEYVNNLYTLKFEEAGVKGFTNSNVWNMLQDVLPDTTYIQNQLGNENIVDTTSWVPTILMTNTAISPIDRIRITAYEISKSLFSNYILPTLPTAKHLQNNTAPPQSYLSTYLYGLRDMHPSDEHITVFAFPCRSFNPEVSPRRQQELKDISAKAALYSPGKTAYFKDYLMHELIRLRNITVPDRYYYSYNDADFYELCTEEAHITVVPYALNPNRSKEREGYYAIRDHYTQKNGRRHVFDKFMEIIKKHTNRQSAYSGYLELYTELISVMDTNDVLMSGDTAPMSDSNILETFISRYGFHVLPFINSYPQVFLISGGFLFDMLMIDSNLTTLMNIQNPVARIMSFHILSNPSIVHIDFQRFVSKINTSHITSEQDIKRIVHEMSSPARTRYP